jgi:hypothetical protein
MKNWSPTLVFFLCFVVIALPLFIFPINLFSGEIVIANGLQNVVEEAPLSLSYFVGNGYDPADLLNIASFRLTVRGWIMAVIFLIGMPALVAYRFHLSQHKRKNT